VAAGARLEYLPEPVVASAGARHATIIRVTLAEGASLLLRDELLLGRHGETGGAARSVLNVDYAGRPLLRQSLEVSGADAVAMGPALLAGHRAVGTALWVDPADGQAPDAGAEQAQGAGAAADAAVAVMPLAGPGVLVTALADDAVALRRCLSQTPSTRTPTGLELGLQGFYFAGVGAELLEGGALADAGQGPADGLGPAAGDADGDQRVEGLQVLLAEPGHDRGEAGATPRAGRALAELDNRLSFARIGAGRELERHPSREAVKLAPELVQGLAVPVVERVERLTALRFVVRRLDDHPGQQLPGLDLRLVAVLEHLDPRDRRAGKALAYLLGELLADVRELGFFHDGLTSELRV
jgi:hypothetical protein